MLLFRIQMFVVNPDAAEASGVTTRILFGSCNKVDAPQPLWPHILGRKPDVWIWGGDNIYADVPSFHAFPVPGVDTMPADPPRLKELYAKQLQEPGYQQLLHSSAALVGTWDDHDFGLNDGDRRYPWRNESQAAFLDFIGEPPGSPRRQQRGVFTSRRFDFAGGSVLVVLLDLRYHRDPYGTPNGDFLGEEQWQWLEGTLTNSTADVHLLVTSLQFLEGRHGAGENWPRFPEARQRFLDLLARLRVSAPVLLSGDVHLAELGMGSCSGGRLLEVTSSGMTHSWGTRDASFNNPLLGFSMHAFMVLAQAVVPWRYQMHEPSTDSAMYYLGLNFGELELDWQRRSLAVRIIGDDGLPRLQRLFQFQDLGIGRLGAEGAQDFAPERGEAEVWRVGLGMAILAGTPLLCMLGFFGLFCLGAWRCQRALRRFHQTSEPDSMSESGSESDSSDTGSPSEPSGRDRPLFLLQIR